MVSYIRKPCNISGQGGDRGVVIEHLIAIIVCILKKNG